MIKEFIINASVLISFISLTFFFVINDKISKFSPLCLRVLAGIGCGLLGVLFITCGFSISSAVVMDFRYIALIISCVCGNLSVLVTGIMVGLFNVWYYGLNVTTVAINILLAVLIMGIMIISNFNLYFGKKWFFMNLWAMILVGLKIVLLVPDKSALKLPIIEYFLLMLVVGIFGNLYIRYLMEFGKMYYKLKLEATTDPLTELNNVRQFERSFKRMISKAGEMKQPLSLLLIDIDYFKKINDSYGHGKGDEVLKTVSSVFRENSRDADLVARIGGEEFAIILFGCDSNHAKKIAEKIRTTIEAYQFKDLNEENFHVTISIGIVTCYNGRQKINELRELADEALYQAKYSGRNKVVVAK